LRLKDEFLAALRQEMVLQRDYLQGEILETIYLGGGTPSLLSYDELMQLFEAIHANFRVSQDPEITLEANPDDLSSEYLTALRKTPVNRLSIGIQSFAEEDLRYMNRAHNAIEARACIEYAQDKGFDNLTVDLIYGSPTTSHKQWERNLNTIFEYDIPHVSCYALTVEPRTALENHVRRGLIRAPSEDKTAEQFETLMTLMRKYGYVHYEISNFAQPNRFARHNANYWRGVSYLGLGPSAHSFDGKSRQWNVANNAQYIKSIQTNQLPFTREELNLNQRYNEYVMTSLRTIWGCDPHYILENFGRKTLQHFNKQILPYVQNQTIETDDKCYFLTDKGRLLADGIAADLFKIA
jgi:oxygen-independent coproporphyrinogen-3 oxidase